MTLIVIILLVLLLVGGLPVVPWNAGRNWGYYPSGIIGTILLILIVLALLRYV